jgi:hypothetical protein
MILKVPLRSSHLSLSPLLLLRYVLFVKLLEENIRKVKLGTPDYKDMDPEVAVLDFKERRANYMTVYEQVDDRDGPYVKIINSKQFVVNNIRGYLPLKVRTARHTKIHCCLPREITEGNR